MHARFMVRNAKRMQGVVILLNATRDCIASVIEFVCGSGRPRCAPHGSRGPIPWPARLDALIGEHESLAWPAPRSGAISV